MQDLTDNNFEIEIPGFWNRAWDGTKWGLGKTWSGIKWTGSKIKCWGGRGKAPKHRDDLLVDPGAPQAAYELMERR